MTVKFINNLYRILNFENIVIILSILLSKSLYYETFGENKLIILLLGLAVTNILYKTYRKQLFFLKKSILLYVAIIIIIFINPNAKMSTSLVFTGLLTISLWFTTIIPLSHFTKVFYNLTKVLMIASLFRYLFIFTDLSTIFQDFISIEGDRYINFLLFGILKEEQAFLGTIRNNGLWWEPGAFQVIINTAFLLGLAFKRVSIKDYFLFLIVIISTGSTAGILIFSTLSFIYYRQNINYKLIFISLLIIFPFLFLTSFYEIVIESKLNLGNASANSRFNDAAVAIKMFLDYPFMGTGFGDIEILEKYTSKYSYGTGSNGILLLLANLGILSFTIFIPLIFPGYLKGFNKKIDKIIVSLSLFLIFFTQNFTIMLVFSILIFYGAKKYELINFIKSKNE
mgnify:CR=1 FL=1